MSNGQMVLDPKSGKFPYLQQCSAGYGLSFLVSWDGTVNFMLILLFFIMSDDIPKK
jgi:hypothetical protein